ncbi:MAG: hypothetical protein ACSLFB_05945 [Acidimicrobiales bacterium]
MDNDPEAIDEVRTKIDEIMLLTFFWAQFITYAMSVIRWFATDHYSFWHGFKELIWALFPIVNFTYVWDWWLAIFQFIFLIIQAALHWLVTK